jgi:N-acetylglucosamine-6-phosphate deacetylase
MLSKLWMLALMFFTSPLAAETVVYTDALILRGGEWKQEDLWVQDGQIIEEVTQADHTVSLEGGFLTPGYIDLQLNGAYGVDFARDPAGLLRVTERLPATGVTSFLPTLVSSHPPRYATALPCLQSCLGRTQGAEALGIHLEGPFIAREKKGAHDASCLHAPTAGLEDILDCYSGLEGVKIVTLAPELEGANTSIRALREQGICVALGHTVATRKEVLEAVHSGATWVTHLFNAMPGLHHRQPGPIGAVLGDRALSYTLIADGIHSDPSVVRLAWQAHPEGCVLITDAMAAMGLEDGSYTLGDLEVEVAEGAARLAGTETLAGSVLCMDAAVRNLWRFSGCRKEEALAAATEKPARLLGLYPRKGSLEVGADADFLLLNEALEVQAAWVAGRCVYRGEDAPVTLAGKP